MNLNPSGWLTARDPNAHECKPPTRPPLFAEVRERDYWRCPCGTLHVLVGLDQLPLRWRPAPADPGSQLQPLGFSLRDGGGPHGDGPCPEDHGEFRAWVVALVAMVLIVALAVLGAVLAVTS